MNPLPNPNTVDVWTADMGMFFAVSDCLSQNEHCAADRMARPDLRRRAKARRSFLRHVLASYLDACPADLMLTTAEGGKPALLTQTALTFNMSHSGEFSILAVGQVPIGLDVETVRRMVDLDALLPKTCAPREQSEVRNSPDPDQAFLQRWICKEALLKCVGTGLIDDLPGIDPGPLDAADPQWNGLSLYPVILKPPYIAALASEQPIAHMRIRPWPNPRRAPAADDWDIPAQDRQVIL